MAKFDRNTRDKAHTLNRDAWLVSYGPLALYISTAKKTSTRPPIVDMGLSNLPAVVLDVFVEFAGYEQGWRLEIASQSLKAA